MVCAVKVGGPTVALTATFCPVAPVEVTVIFPEYGLPAWVALDKTTT